MNKSAIRIIREGIESGSLKMDLDSLNLRVQNGEWISVPFPSWIETEGSRFALCIRTGSATQLLRQDLAEELKPFLSFGSSDPRILTQDDFFEGSARTASGVQISLKHLAPVTSISAENHINTSVMNFHRLDYISEGFASENYTNTGEYLGEPEENTEASESENKNDYISATIPGVDFLLERQSTEVVKKHPFFGEQTSTSRNCYCGKVCGGDFCIEQKDGNTNITFKRPVNEESKEEVQSMFQGILEAYGLLHGAHPLPSYYSHSRGGQKHEHWSKVVADLQKNPMLPISKSTIFFKKEGDTLFRLAAEFFAPKTEESEFVSKSLWLMREASTKRAAFQIKLLVLCSIFEGLLKPHRGKKPTGKMSATQLNDFRWKEPIESLGLNWEHFLPAVESFNTFRNPLAHGFDSEESSDDFAEMIKGYSRLSGAIYLIIAKRMRFSGDLELSQLEFKKAVKID